MDVFSTKCLLTDNENPTISDTYFEKIAIIDTGCTTTSLMNIDYWDFNLLKFVETPPALYFSAFRTNPKMKEWETNKYYCEVVPMGTTGGIVPEIVIHFKTPMYIGLKYLKFIPLNSLVVYSTRETQKYYLIGLDFICQHKLTIGPNEKNKITMDLELIESQGK